MTGGADLGGFNPADTFTFVLDQEIRKAGMPGGYGGFALELAATPDLTRLRERLDLIVARFPMATARAERRGKRWFWVATGRRVELECIPLPAGEPPALAARRLAQDLLSRPAPLDSALPLTLHWLQGGAGGVLLLRWWHPLLDARGAGMILDLLGGAEPDRFKESPSLVLQKLAEWPWWKKIRFFFLAKGHNARLNRLYSCLPTAEEQGTQALRVEVRRYTPEQTARIAQLAQAATGLAGKSLYTLGGFMRAMERAGPPVARAGYCIPYAYNLRRQNAPTPVFGNHVSCLFAQASREQVRDRAGLMAHLLAQYRRTVREQLDLAYLPLMWLGQWLSPERYAPLLRKQPGGGELSSCWFSDIGEVRFPAGSFLGTAITGMFHLSWTTLPPGLALLSGQLDGRLTLSCNYLHPAVDQGWVKRVLEFLDAELLREAD